MVLVVHRLAVAGDEVHVNIQKEVLSGVSLIGGLPPFSFFEGSFGREGLCGPHDRYYYYLPHGGALPSASHSKD